MRDFFIYFFLHVLMLIFGDCAWVHADLSFHSVCLFFWNCSVVINKTNEDMWKYWFGMEELSVHRIGFLVCFIIYSFF